MTSLRIRNKKPLAKVFVKSMCVIYISFFFLCSIITVIPGVIDTRGYAEFSFCTENLKDDDPTKLLGEKFFANSKKRSSQAQSPAEVAEYILKAMTDENPQPHYITNKGFEEGFGKAKFCDTTGRIPFEMSKNFLA